MSCPPLKDWPEGATHFDWHDKNYLMKCFGAVLVWHRGNGWSDSCGQYAVVPDDAYARPLPEPWTGEGLPPVGTVCEAQIFNGRGSLVWVEARVLHHHSRHKKSAAIVYSNEELLAWTGMFRPIKTPEQIAAEERTRAIDEMHRVAGEPAAGSTIRASLSALYDAGYRKQVAP